MGYCYLCKGFFYTFLTVSPALYIHLGLNLENLTPGSPTVIIFMIAMRILAIVVIYISSVAVGEKKDG